MESGSSCGIGAFWTTIGRLVLTLAWDSPADGPNGRDAFKIRTGYYNNYIEHTHNAGEREGEQASNGYE